jgi:hypothetical protein
VSTQNKTVTDKRRAPKKQVNAEHAEIALAWLHGDLTYREAAAKLGVRQSGVGHYLAVVLRACCQQHHLTFPELIRQKKVPNFS